MALNQSTLQIYSSLTNECILCFIEYLIIFKAIVCMTMATYCSMHEFGPLGGRH